MIRRELQLALGAAVLSFAPSCTASEDAPQGDDGNNIPVYPQITVELDDGSGGVGSALFYELDVRSDATCVASVVLASRDRYGTCVPSNLAFLDRTPGTGSIEIAGTGYNSVYWNPADSAAVFEELTDSWSGAFVLSEWSEERIAITLQAGQHCPLGGTTAGCSPATGMLLIEGPRIPDTADPNGARFTDLATAQVLCDTAW